MPHQRVVLALSAFALVVFGSGCGDTTAPEFIAPPTIATNPNETVPLAAIVSAVTNEPSTLVIQVSDGEHQWDVPAASEFATELSAPVLGFRPDRGHVVEVSARDAAGNTSAAARLEFETEPLPADFPSIKLSVSRPEMMEPGVTLFGLMRWPDEAAEDDEYGLAIAVDEEGEVVWYRRTDHILEDPHRISNGNTLQLLGQNRVQEVDMLGNVAAQWHASTHPSEEANAKVEAGSVPVAADTLHHDIQEMPSGNLLVLSTEMRRIDDYPTSVEDVNAPTAPANVIGDIVVEFSRDGSIVNEWKLMDMLDVRRLGYESLSGIWDIWAYPDVEGGTTDWSHANSLFYDATTDSVLVSLRHQEAVISFSRESGELNWILGDHDGWGERWQPYLLKPEGDFEWQYHQHAAEITAAGSMILFDNGNFRAMPPKPKLEAGESYSRAVEFAIDADAKTVRQIWKYGGPGGEMFFSPFISEADQLPQTGNVLITDGGQVRDQEGRATDRIVGDHHWSRIVEVTHANTPEKVFEIIIDSSDDEPTIGWAVYRSDRLTSLYAR